MQASRQIPLKFKTPQTARQMDFHLCLSGGAKTSRFTAGAVSGNSPRSESTPAPDRAGVAVSGFPNWLRIDSLIRPGQWFYRNELSGYTVTFSRFNLGWVSSGGAAAGSHVSAEAAMRFVDSMVVTKGAK